MRNNKFQMTNFKIMIPLLVFLLTTAFACTKVDKPVRGEDESNPSHIVIYGDPPDSHVANTTSEGTPLRKEGFFSSSLRGLGYWKAYHPTLVTGTHNPALIVATEDEEELCLDCHDQNTSCNNCHSYVGVKLITSDED